jgi:hypothetical protein
VTFRCFMRIDHDALAHDLRHELTNMAEDTDGDAELICDQLTECLGSLLDSHAP